MKSKIFNVIILILMLFVTAISLNGRVSHREGSIIEITHFSGKGVHLMTIYGDSVPLPASLQGKKLSKIHYNGEDDYLKDGIKLKLESVGFKEFPYERLVTLGTLFTYSPKKGQVYSFNGILTKGISSQELVVEYKGKSIKYSLHYELRLVLINGEDGIEVEDMEVVKLYSGDEGFGTSQIGN